MSVCVDHVTVQTAGEETSLVGSMSSIIGRYSR